MNGQRPHVGNTGHGMGVQVHSGATGDATRAPFPWYGGKRRWADRINDKLGTVGVYVEPFAGSIAVLLTRQPAPREIICDTDGLICNAWRAMRDHPDETAYYAAWPTLHHDLTARQPWLIQWRREHAAEMLVEDPEWCDPRAAGWWIWGASNWIGGGWCQDAHGMIARPAVKAKGGWGVQAQRCDDKRPHVAYGGGYGVQAQRTADKVPRVSNATHGPTATGVQAQRGGQIPKVSDFNGGKGVQAQRVTDKRPHVGGRTSGQGVQPTAPGGQRPHVGGRVNGQGAQPTAPVESDGDILDGSRWQPWFRALAKRLERVVVLNRSWESAVTPSMLQHTPSGPKPSVGIFLDPPYRTRDDKGATTRDGAIYHGDEYADDVAVAAFRWAVEHGERFRIAYACRAGDFKPPKGWTVESDSFAGVRAAERRAKHRDCVMFSPACVGQKELF